jgi:carbonic anhydrase/acetyltransferase-like protein (isoleucine patch superfamily)/Flp pilus assembly protein TadD
MRFLQIASFYPAYLTSFYGHHRELAAAPFEQQIDGLLADGFGGGHLIAPAMATVGFQPTLIITNALPAQNQWAVAHGLPTPRSHADLAALVARQVEEIDPDVLYVLDPIAFDGRFLAQLRVKPRLVVGWRAANIPAGTTWEGYDVMLSSDEGCRRRALELGASVAENFKPGFPKRLADRVADVPKNADIVFCGQFTVEHQKRIAAMQRLMDGLEDMPNFKAALHLGLPQNGNFPPSITRHDKGAVWGLDMYKAVRGGKVAPNFHIDLVTNRNQNMRILETTGVGTLLLTEYDDHLHETFVPGKEVETYRNDTELLEKARWYIAHDKEREEIAKRGQERCFAEHSTEKRAQELAALIGRYLNEAAPRRAKDAASTPAQAQTTEGPVEQAIAHLVVGRINDAASVLNAAIQRDNANPRALHLLGRVAFLVGEGSSAIELFQTAMMLKPPPEHAWRCAVDLSAAMVRQGRKADAAGVLREAYALSPKNTGIAERLATLLAELGATDEAELIKTRLPDFKPVLALDALSDLRALAPAPPTSAASGPINIAQAFPGVTFGQGVQCIGVGSIRIGRGTAIADHTWLNVCTNDGKPRLVIGESVLVGRRAVLSSSTYLEIGAHTIFGPNVYVASSAHEYIGNHLKPILMCGIRDLGRVVVEENCWLGMNAVVDGDITVGRGSVVGANSVLRQSIPPFSLAVGAPARIIRMLNPETEQWEPVDNDADRARIEAARARKPFPDRAAYKALLDKACGGARGVHPAVAGNNMHLP